MREIRPSGSEGGGDASLSLPLSANRCNPFGVKWMRNSGNGLYCHHLALEC